MYTLPYLQLWLCWVCCTQAFSSCENWGYSSCHPMLLTQGNLLWSTGSRHELPQFPLAWPEGPQAAGLQAVVVARSSEHMPQFAAPQAQLLLTGRNLSDQESNPGPLHWHSHPLHHQESLEAWSLNRWTVREVLGPHAWKCHRNARPGGSLFFLLFAAEDVLSSETHICHFWTVFLHRPLIFFPSGFNPF